MTGGSWRLRVSLNKRISFLSIGWASRRPSVSPSQFENSMFDSDVYDKQSIGPVAPVLIDCGLYHREPRIHINLALAPQTAPKTLFALRFRRICLVQTLPFLPSSLSRHACICTSPFLSQQPGGTRNHAVVLLIINPPPGSRVISIQGDGNMTCSVVHLRT